MDTDRVADSVVGAIVAVQVVDPWTVSSGADGTIDYNKLLEQVRTMPHCWQRHAM